MNRMPSKLYDLLKEKLGEEKYEDKSVFEMMQEIFDKAEAAKEIQTANADLTTKKKELGTKIEELNAQIDTIKSESEAEIKRLMENTLTDDDKKKLQQMKDKGMSTEIEAKLNDLMSKLETSHNRITELEELNKSSDAEKKAAKLNEFKTANLTQMERALNEVGIKGNNAEVAMAVIDKRGLYDIVDNEGNLKFNIYTKRDGQLFPSDANNLATELAKEFENLVEPSGNNGGNSGYNPGNKPDVNIPQNTANLYEARAKTDSLFDKFFR